MVPKLLAPSPSPAPSSIPEVALMLELGRVLQDQLDVPSARRLLAELAARPPRFGPWLSALAYGLASSGMANIFGGGWREMLLAALVGMLVGAALQVSYGRRQFPAGGSEFVHPCSQR